MSVRPEDERFMAEAISLSLEHLGQTSTNPSVGCLIVSHGEVVGRAVTAVGGRPHAETQALDDAGEKARGATAYVTLEPCSHYGRTPPCANALIAAGIKRAVIALVDPDERVAGRGLKLLIDAGVEVTTGVLEKEARRALAGYLSRQTKKRPQVILKLAVSQDGMIGRRGAGQVAITGPAARAEVHRLRSVSDAILVGIGTVIADDPELTVRLPSLEDRSPVRIVLDGQLRLPLSSKLAKSARQVPVIVACKPEAAGTRQHADLQAAGVEVLPVADLRSLLGELAARGLSTLIVEGGAFVARAFLDADYVDRIDLYTGSVSLGAGGIESPVSRTNIPAGFELFHQENLGGDILQQYERAS
ncbi:bifunctional diaminohydroxyphosphoribosylaminopyrimidine deaminase/5-amino-6-(5-phosphoribosylamino)uracil reductase RibD [Ciceribacter sp. L1K23]|uniref:bifunctional diaminohydroxyphosphoribosylaminopyrimidine deaminase/5-amino-6-(5-phosphoribosylamino)uracil reductase RibD n=1 Tax=Ciceribacter sp. L1K23 TaxID=2820276 RepID=UPI0032C236FD